VRRDAGRAFDVPRPGPRWIRADPIVAVLEVVDHAFVEAAADATAAARAARPTGAGAGGGAATSRRRVPARIDRPTGATATGAAGAAEETDDQRGQSEPIASATPRKTGRSCIR